MSLETPVNPLSPDSLQSCRSASSKLKPSVRIDKRHRERIEIAHAIVVRQTGLRAHAHAVANRHAIQYARDAGTAAQMTGNHAQVGLLHRRLAAVHVKILRASGDIRTARAIPPSVRQ